jgi:hypothetical protein
VLWDNAVLTRLTPNASSGYDMNIGTHPLGWQVASADAGTCLDAQAHPINCGTTVVCPSAGFQVTAAGANVGPCNFDARPRCERENTVLLLLANTSPHQDDILVDRVDYGVLDPAADPANPLPFDFHGFVLPPGTHHVDFLHYPPPRWNACVDITLTLTTCQAQAWYCAY